LKKTVVETPRIKRHLAIEGIHRRCFLPIPQTENKKYMRTAEAVRIRNGSVK
jgi:hypothetical protein